MNWLHWICIRRLCRSYLVLNKGNISSIYGNISIIYGTVLVSVMPATNWIAKHSPNPLYSWIASLFWEPDLCWVSRDKYHYIIYDYKKPRNAQHWCDLGIIRPEYGFSTNIKYMGFNLIHISTRTIYYSIECWGSDRCYRWFNTKKGQLGLKSGFSHFTTHINMI